MQPEDGAALRVAELGETDLTVIADGDVAFELGAGDFFLINLREESAADARVRAIRADLNGRLAAASYNAATMNLEELGLD